MPSFPHYSTQNPVNFSTPPDLTDFLERRERLFKLIDQTYAKDKNGKIGQANVIKDKLNQRWSATQSHFESAEILKLAEENIARHKILIDDLANVKRQKAEVTKARNNPGEIDMQKVGNLMELKMGVGKRYWNASHEEFGAQFYSDEESRKDILQKIKKHKNEVIHTKPNTRPTKIFPPFLTFPAAGSKGLFPKQIAGYQRLLDEADAQASKDLLENTMDLESILNHGRVLPRERNGFSKGMESLSEVAAAAARIPIITAGTLANKLGRGIISKSDPLDNLNYEKYLQHRNAIVSDLLWKFNPDGTRHAKLMQQYKDLLQKHMDGDGLIDKEGFQELMKLIEDEAKAANVGHEEQIKEMNAALNNLNEKAYDDVKANTKEEDGMFKYRALQLFLIASPFAGILYMGPVLDVFSEVFQNSGGLADGIASLALIDPTGIFGPLISDFVSWILTDLPIVSDLVEVADYAIGGPIVQTALAGVVMPVLAGPLTPLAIVGVYSLYRASSEADHWEKYHDSKSGKFPQHTKALNDKIAALRKELKDPDKIRTEKFKKEATDLIEKAADSNFSRDKKSNLKNLLNFNQDLSRDQIAKARAQLEEGLNNLGFKDKDAQNKLKLAVLNSFDTFHAGPNLDEFYEKKMKILEKGHTTKFLASFITRSCETDPTSQETLFKKLFSADNILPSLMTCFDNNQKISQEKLYDFLTKEENKEFCQKLDRRILYFISTADGKKSFDEMIAKTNSDFAKAASDRKFANDIENVIKNEKIHRNQEFILGLAQQQEIRYQSAIEALPFDDERRTKEISRIEKLLKEQELGQMKEIIRKDRGLVLSNNQSKVLNTLKPGTAPLPLNGKAAFINNQGQVLVN